MKYFDKFLKLLKTDRNSFCTYVLTLCSIYVIVDRFVEFLLILFTGVGSNYWGPIRYSIAYVFVIFAFQFSMSSKFIRHDADKRHFFYWYCIGLYLVTILMAVEWINRLCWLGLLFLPGYTELVTNFAYLIRPALSSLALAVPLLTWRNLFNKLYMGVNDTKPDRDSIAEYTGINLSDPNIGWGAYTNEIYIGIDKDFANDVKLAEVKRFESTLVCGVSGAGKTSLIFEPWVAQDINRKFFYRESSKTLAFAALRTGIARLNAPYDNAYINEHFTLNMLLPVESKEDLYKSYFKKFIMGKNGSKYVYKNCGITYMAPDYETVGRVRNICDNFGLSYKIVDPDDVNSIGLNPFSFDDPVKTSLAITTVLKGFYTDRNPEMEMAYKENLSTQVIENLAILLKIIYPKINNGKLPNIEDMLKLLSNFDLIEKMCKILEQDEDLAEQYQNQINYFKKNFYADSSNRNDMEQLVSIPMSQLDTLLRYPGVKGILCNRNNNINFDEVLEDGEICLVCTRRGDLGESAHKAFGLFFLLLMQFSVLRRPGNENTRVPNFLYIDEFPDFICPATESIFTVYRKYRVATVISAQNLAQLHAHGEKLGDTIIANCSNKIVFGNNSPEDNEWWSLEIGEKKEWTIKKNAYNFKNDEYEGKGTADYGWHLRYPPGKIQGLKFKRCMFKINTLQGVYYNGCANLDFLPSKYNEKQKVKVYNFAKYAGDGSSSDIVENYVDNKLNKLRASSLVNTHFDDGNDDNPIQMDTTNLSFDINNSDAITFTFKNKNNTAE